MLAFQLRNQRTQLLELANLVLELLALRAHEVVQSHDVEMRIALALVDDLEQVILRHAELASGIETQQHVHRDLSLCRALLDELDVELRLGREHADAIRNRMGDVAGLLVHARVHDLVCGDANVLANGKLAGTAYLETLPVIGRGSREEGVGLHREAKAYVLAKDVGDLVEALPELAHIEDEGRRTVFLGNLEKLAIVHVTSSVQSE